MVANLLVAINEALFPAMYREIYELSKGTKKKVLDKKNMKSFVFKEKERKKELGERKEGKLKGFSIR